MVEIQVALGDRSYPVTIQSGLFPRLSESLTEFAPSQRYFLVCDQNVYNLYSGSFPSDDTRYKTCVISSGETSKTVETLQSIWTFLLENGVERGHVLVAVGGGVLGDVAGFAAATILRGIRLVQVPTTLLAQVDASIGGKAGINHPLGKNLVGAFHQPCAVLIDPAFLRTLPESEFRSGMYEVIKYALIEKNGLYEQLIAGNWQHGSDISAIIEPCVRCKAAVVAADEKEGGRRMILNFGHTLGHAIEAAGEFREFTHGQAVGWGILFAARLAESIRLCNPSTVADIERLVRKNGELPALNCSPSFLLEKMRHDKKVRDGSFTFVLPTEIGKVTIRTAIPVELVRAKLEGFLL